MVVTIAVGFYQNALFRQGVYKKSGDSSYVIYWYALCLIGLL